MKKNILFVLFLFLNLNLILNLSCSTTDPYIKPPVEPDSTTQNFTFETFEFGDGFESSWLNDVWIFDENNIWAVGYINDTTTNNLPVNIIRWNGNNWAGYGPQFNSSGIYGIWAIDSANIFFAVGAVVQYKSGNFIEFNLGNLGFTQGQGVHKLWGSGENNIWGIGPNSTIVHYDGVAWSKIAFDEGWYFYDITGNSKTGNAFAVAQGNQGESIIVELKNGTAVIIFNNQNSVYYAYGLQSILQYSENELWLSGSKIFSYNLITSELKIIQDLPLGDDVGKVSMTSQKDVFYWGNGTDLQGKFVHYNGKRFKMFTIPTAYTPYPEGINAINNLAVAVGSVGNKAFLLKIIRP
ncbi:MAG: hypothetical protein EHM44_08695 [Ignavibacteriales bacterium]|nr:MAG: hypothetical protein EHM44_08695 [Ignavibacteriales bacterium]